MTSKKQTENKNHYLNDNDNENSHGTDKKYEKKCDCEDNNKHNHKEKYDCKDNNKYNHKEKCDCEDNNKHNHDKHEGCACEHGLLEDIDNIQEEKSKKPLLILGIGAIIFSIAYIISTLNFTIADNINQNLISQIIYLIVVIIAGQGIIKQGIKSLLNKEVKIEFLITIATIGAFLLGDGGEGAILILLFFLAEYLEHYSLDRSKRSLSKLVKLSPDTAIIKQNINIENNIKEIEENKEKTEKNIKEIEVNVGDLEIGDIVIVKPGDKIPIDGIITHGITSVNQASITGESLAITKSVGDEVYASTINEDGYIEIKVTKRSNETIFSKIIDLIKESNEKKAKIDQFVDKFAKYYTPTIIVLAILVAIIPPLLFNQDINQWICRGLVLLVISCPCAIAISTPVSIVSAITAGTKNGIIIKGGEYIEELAKIKAIMFDKTGTLTEGNLEITNIDSVHDFSEDKIIEIACSLENKSKHPIAKAFKEYLNKYAENKNIKLKNVQKFKSIAGKGLKGEIDGETYYVGKRELFNHNKKLKEEIDYYYNNNSVNKEEMLENFGKTAVIVGNKNKLLGFINLTDKIRENGKKTINGLKEKSIKTIMLTGDNSATAKIVADNLSLDSYYSNLLPEDKVNIVDELVKKCKNVAMVGDGVNDTPSLARANVGIAMGMSGADVAIETADIVLMQDNILKIDYLINLSKKTMGVIKQNIAIPLTVKATLAILGIIGYVSLWEAVLIGDMGLTLLVVANALRIARK